MTLSSFIVLVLLVMASLSAAVLITMVGPRNVLSNDYGTAVIPAAPGLANFIQENLQAFGGLVQSSYEWEGCGEKLTMVHRAQGVPPSAIHHIVVGLLGTANVV